MMKSRIFQFIMTFAEMNDMRYMLIVNLILLIIAVALFYVDKGIDDSALVGTKVNVQALQGKSLQEVIVGQPVIPDHISLFLDGRLIGLVYQHSRLWWHEYPYVNINLYKDSVDAVWVRERSSGRRR